MISSLRGISFSLLIALLASTHFMSPHFLDFSITTLLSSLLVTNNIPTLQIMSQSRDHHSHHHQNDSKIITSICDNFPPNFPPPDTNTTSTICVDRNGCCNFTTVQSAVDAVAVLSPKRTIIWINTGIYL